MPKEPEQYASQIKYCPGDGRTICGSSNVKFKYSNNGKPDQPRYQCLDCKTMFSLGDHRRKKPGHYTKERNKDPEEFRGLHIKCSRCGAANQSRFKYYNNNCPTQPRFQCLSCTKQFQMRFSGHTLAAARSNLSKPKPAKPKPPKTKPAKTKRGKRSSPLPEATTSADDGCDGMVYEAQVGEFSRRQDENLYGAPNQYASMEKYSGGQWFNPEGVMAQPSASLYPSEYVYGDNGLLHAAQVGQLDRSIYSEPVPIQQFDNGQYSLPQGMEAQASMDAATDQQCEYGAAAFACDGVLDVAQAGQFDQTMYGAQCGTSEPVPMQQFDNGQYSLPQGMEASAGSMFSSVEGCEHGASAYENYGGVSAAQVGQFFNTEDQTLYGDPDCVPEEQFYVGQYCSNFPRGVEASASLYGSETEYVHGAWASQSDAVNVVQAPVVAAAAIPSDIPNYDTGAACEGLEVIADDVEQFSDTDAVACVYDEEVNADQVEAFLSTDAHVPVGQSDVGECRENAEIAAARAIPFPSPSDDAMMFLVYYEEDEDALRLWD